MIRYKVTTTIDNTQEFFDNTDDLKQYLLDKCSLGSKYLDYYIDSMNEEIEIYSFIFKPSDIFKKVNPEYYKELYSIILNQELIMFEFLELPEKLKSTDFWFFNTFHIEIIK
jgi:hypothetical protein